MLRHEQQSIRMALATFTHHSAQRQKTASARGVEREENYGPRLLEPPFPQGAATVVYVAAGARGADGVEDTAVKFLLRAELKKKKEEEEKERKAEEEKHERMLALNHLVGEGLSLTDAEWSAWSKWASSSLSAGKRRKRKKRMKKKMRSLSVVRCSCVHRRVAEVAALIVDSCICMCMAGFTGVAPFAVFLSSAVTPKMLDTLAGINQKDSYAVRLCSL